MKKKILIILFCGVMVLGVTGCGNKVEKSNENKRDSRGLYLIATSMERYIYSDEEDPMFMEYGKKTSIKDFLPHSNCIYSCIYNESDPIEILWHGGTNVYEYMVEDEKYYLI